MQFYQIIKFSILISILLMHFINSNKLHSKNSKISINQLYNSIDKIYANSIGERVIMGQIKHPPFKIDRCDQVVFIQGQRFLDYSDFSKRIDSFYQIGIYIINIFESKNNEKLINSIEMNKLEKIPELINGARNCLDIKEINGVRFPMCLESEEIMNQIIKVFKDFQLCRGGFNLKDKVICPPKKKKLKYENNSNNNNIIKKREDKKKKNLNPFYPERVPGS